MSEEIISFGQGPVYPIPAFFDDNGNLCTGRVQDYVDYLAQEGASTIMTTAGTSMHALLSADEVRLFNEACSSFPGPKILAIRSGSQRDMLHDIEEMNEKEYARTALMVMYPDRFYTGQEIIDCILECADNSAYPLFFHGMFMRNARDGGVYNFNAKLVNELASHPNVIGMKEESTTLSIGYDLCRNIEYSDFISIVAGGSMKRHWLLGLGGATTFLTGIGNLFPAIEEAFFDAYQQKEFGACVEWIKEFETPFFDVCMRIGWHPCLREGLNYIGFQTGYRAPFVQLSENEKHDVHTIIDTIKEKYNDRYVDNWAVLH